MPSAESLAPQPVKYNRALFVINPASTHAQSRRVGRRVAALKEALPNHHQISTTGDEIRDTELLYEHVADGDVVINVSGDGNAGRVGTRLAQPAFQERDISFTVCEAGNANNFARSTLGRLGVGQLAKTLYKARRVPVFPLQLSATPPNGPQEDRLALNYIGFGVSAAISAIVNQQGHRNRSGYKNRLVRSFHEVKGALGALSNMEAFLISTPDNRLAQTRYELLVSNVPLVAKGGNIPVTVDQPQAYKLEHATKAFGATAAVIGRILLGRLSEDPRRYLGPANPFAFTLHSDGVALQLDGETARGGQPFLFPAGTAFTISIHKYPVWALKAENK